MSTNLHWLFFRLLYFFLQCHIQWSLKVGVLGGGAAGYFAAIQCAEVMKEKDYKDCEVIVFEGTKEVLAKVLISGGGRCNVQHDSTKDVLDISKGYPRGQRELLGPLSKTFGPIETKHWFESKGVKLKTEPDGRVFPCTDKSLTIKTALEEAAKNTGKIKICCNSKVISIEEKKDEYIKHDNDDHKKFIVTINHSGGISTNNENSSSSSSASNNKGKKSVKKEEKFYLDKIIAATGSSRQGHEMMAALGHTIISPVPSLFSFKINDSNLTQLSGLSTELSEVKLVIPKEFSKNNKALLR